MDILYLLIPLSVILVLMVLAGLWWAIYHGHDRKLTHNRVVVVRSHCFWRIHRAPRFITGIVLFK